MTITLITETEQPKRQHKWDLYWFHRTDPDANYQADPETLRRAGFVPASEYERLLEFVQTYGRTFFEALYAECSTSDNLQRKLEATSGLAQLQKFREIPAPEVSKETGDELEELFVELAAGATPNERVLASQVTRLNRRVTALEALVKKP